MLLPLLLGQGAGGGTSHNASGTLAGAGPVLAATASRFRAFSASGALSGAGPAVAGSARLYVLHVSSGDIAGASPAIAGSSARFRVLSATGTLAGGVSGIAGASARFRAHESNGSIAGAGAGLAGSAERTKAHPSSGVLIASDGLLSGYDSLEYIGGVSPRFRPQVPVSHANHVIHRRLIAERANVGLPTDGSKAMEYPLPLKSYTVALLPTASDWGAGMIYVSNESGGATLAFSDGANWRRVQDRAIVS